MDACHTHDAPLSHLSISQSFLPLKYFDFINFTQGLWGLEISFQRSLAKQALLFGIDFLKPSSPTSLERQILSQALR